MRRATVIKPYLRPSLVDDLVPRRTAARAGPSVVPGELARIKGFQVEDASQDRPRQGQVGDDERRGRLADVPESPVPAEGFREAVVLVEDRAEDLCIASLDEWNRRF